MYTRPSLRVSTTAYTLHTLHTFLTVTSYARYDPSKGYSWQFPSDTPSEITKGAGAEHLSEEQRRRVDRLLTDLTHKFPPKAFGKKVKMPTSLRI